MYSKQVYTTMYSKTILIPRKKGAEPKMLYRVLGFLGIHLKQECYHVLKIIGYEQNGQKVSILK